MTRDHAEVLDAPTTTPPTDPADVDAPGAPGELADITAGDGDGGPGDDDRTGSDDPAEAGADSTVGPGRRVDPRLLIAVGVVVAVGRWWFSRERRVFHVAPDEAAQLAIARVLGGGTHWNMFDHSTWRPLLGTLLSPVYWFTDDATTVVRAALTVNAVLGGLSAVVLALLIARITDLPGWACALLAVALGLAPPALSGTSFVWAEGLVTLVATATVLVLVRFVETPRVSLALVAVVLAAVGLTAHSRLIVLIGPATLIPVVLFARRRRWGDAALTVVVGAVSMGLSLLYADRIYAAVWDDPASNNTVGTVLKRLRDPAEVGDALVGQTWYQLATTFGLAGIGLYALVHTAFRRSDSVAMRERPVVPGLMPPAARTVLVVVLPSIALSMVFMSARTRSDHLVYGRYNDAVMWPIIAVGVAWVVERVVHGVRWRDVWPVLGVAAALAATAAGTDAMHHEQLSSSVGVRAMIPGILPLIGREASIPVVRITVIAAIGLGVIAIGVLLSRLLRRAGVPFGWLLLVGAIVTVAVGAVRTRDVLDIRLNSWATAEAVREVDRLVPPGEVLGVKMVRDRDDPATTWERQRQRYQLYQLYLPSHEIERDRGLDDDVGPYVFAPNGDPELEAAHATVIWRDPVHKISLWREPTPSD